MQRLTYNGFDLTRYCFVRVEKPIAPRLTASSTKLELLDGERYLYSTFDKLTITVHCVLRRQWIADWERIRQVLLMGLCVKGEHELALPDEPGYVRMATCSITSSVTTPIEPPVAFDVEFTCHDPFMLKIRTIELSYENDGAVIPLSIDGIGPTDMYLYVNEPRTYPNDYSVESMRMKWIFGVRRVYPETGLAPYVGVLRFKRGSSYDHSQYISVETSARRAQWWGRYLRYDGSYGTELRAIPELGSFWPSLEPGSYRLELGWADPDTQPSWNPYNYATLQIRERW